MLCSCRFCVLSLIMGHIRRLSYSDPKTRLGRAVRTPLGYVPSSCVELVPTLLRPSARKPDGKNVVDTLFPAGTFKLTLTFTEEYPNKAPVVRFESKMFHPNSTSIHEVALSCACHLALSGVDSSSLTLNPIPTSHSLRGRWHLPRYPAEPVEPHIRRQRHPHQHPGARAHAPPPRGLIPSALSERGCPRRIPQSLLCDPNPNSPANSEAARMYTEARRADTPPLHCLCPA